MKDFLMKIKKERSIRDRIAFFFFFLSFLNDIEKEDEEKKEGENEEKDIFRSNLV